MTLLFFMFKYRKTAPTAVWTFGAIFRYPDIPESHLI